MHDGSSICTNHDDGGDDAAVFSTQFPEFQLVTHPLILQTFSMDGKEGRG